MANKGVVMKNWIKKQMENKSITMPVLSFPAIQKMNINVLELVNSSDYQARGMKIIADEFPISASLSYMDLSVEAEAFGSEIRYSETEVPTVIGKILYDEKDVKKLKVPQVGQARTGKCIEAIKKAKELIKDKPIFAGVIGPFSLSGRLMDMTEIMVNCYEEPEMVHATLEKTSAFLKDYILALKEVGADGVIMAEPAAGLLSPLICDEFSTRYIKQIVEDVSDDKFIFIYHNCGNVVPLKDSILSIKADIYHFGNAIDIEDMLRIMPLDVPVMGNLDPIIFRNGSREEIRKATLDLLNRCSKYENFVISSGCDIPPSSNWDAIDEYFKTVQDFYR